MSHEHIWSTVPLSPQVARKADQNLKQQHMSLLYIRRELDKHVVRLQERTDNGDEHAIAAAEALAGKAIQIEQVLPYLEKCIKVNRQAELQTIAVLQKGREEAMRELDQIHPEGNTGEIPKIVEESTSECDHKDTCDDLESTLTESIRTPSKDTTSSPMFTRSTSTPAQKEKTPPRPLKLHRTHTTESSTSQNSEIFIPKGSILSPQDFIKHAWHRPNSAKSQSSEGDCATPLATSPMVLSPRRFKRSQSSGQPNKMNEGTEVEGNGMLHRPTSASSNRIHMVSVLVVSVFVVSVLVVSVLVVSVFVVSVLVVSVLVVSVLVVSVLGMSVLVVSVLVVSVLGVSVFVVSVLVGSVLVGSVLVGVCLG